MFTSERNIRKSYYNQYSPLDSELKKQIDIAKEKHIFFKDQINVNNINKEDDVKTGNLDTRREDMSGESNITRKFDRILKAMKNNGKTTKSISFISCGSNLNLHPLILKSLDRKRC